MRPLSSVSKSSKLLFSLYLTIALIAGCGGPGLLKVSGKITVDGAPAVGAVLLFHPMDNKDASIASGVAGSDGTFTLTSGIIPGVSAGKYAISVTWPDPSHKPTEAQKMRGEAEPGADLLKGRYVIKEKSGLTAEISSSTKELPPFALKTK